MDKLKFVKKGGLVALGLASITAKKADELINDLTKKGRLTKKQGEELARKVIKETVKEQEKIRKQVVSEVSKSAKRVMSVAQEEAKRLMNQVRKVKKSKAKPKARPKAKPKKAKKKRRR